MTNDEFNNLLEQMERDEKATLIGKGREYTIGNDDRLYNFKEVANTVGVEPLVIWATYFMKHIYSILNYVKDGREASDEGIEGRIKDARNYLALGLALIKEKKNE